METQTVNWSSLLEDLAEPFPASAIYWRAGSTTKDKKRAQALPYAEPRVYEDRLNAVCPGDWSVHFTPWGDNRIICELTIHGVTRSSTGEENDGFAPGTAAEAQAFKRACSKFGLGRYLYDVPISWVDYDDTRCRLVETPSLPVKFLPQAKEVTKEAKPKVVKAPEVTESQVPLLAPERAEAMVIELEKIGFSRAEQLKVATSVLGCPVRAFTQVTEAEALEVWASAKRLGQSVA